mmetsp:Transcript_3331/g.4679  ORF Transcript_3331/g.4679 Transcript_3331/m.4679 type:complete len:156 (-) Transcript_3331:347-814(-)|eukprot:CAMPEP_0117751714 /NCGR_PEP_ID=MMETSP0947-20121206/11146_1 /TAXON_ID=44440 /ORGANISM="Chattonella subsalsa, Strain CCMP2191" /LENGTH=155 /DNA_ID=CAMNT_0005570161 /DNA_START=45 /DNA_END=515 /DNA_ORIENTATION=+
MPIHGVVITNQNGVLLLSKYFETDLESWEQKITYERMLVRSTRQQWSQCGQGKVGIQIARPMRDIFVCFQNVGDLLVFISGTEEYDELTLADILVDLMQMITIHCEDKPSEQMLLQEDAYGKVCLGIDEMMPQGHLEHGTVKDVLRMSKLKPIKS